MTNQSADPRSPLQKAADQIDSDLYRVFLRAEQLYEKHPMSRNAIEQFLRGIRATRPHIRGLMHSYDREKTI